MARRLALVTGGAKGIGLAASRRLVADGLDVIVTGRDAAAIEREASSLSTDDGPSVHGAVMDVSNQADVDRVFAEVADRHGPVSVLVNSAGIVVREPAENVTDEQWSSVIATDLSGVFWCCRAAARHMLPRREGSIITISSLAALTGLSERVAYTSAKAGLSGMTRTLALEWADRGVRVNAIAPGWTATAMVRAGIASGKLNEASLTRRIPMGRLAEPSEMASVTSFLASPDASYLTGQTITVDGGYMVNGNAS